MKLPSQHKPNSVLVHTAIALCRRSSAHPGHTQDTPRTHPGHTQVNPLLTLLDGLLTAAERTCRAASPGRRLGRAPQVGIAGSGAALGGRLAHVAAVPGGGRGDRRRPTCSQRRRLDPARAVPDGLDYRTLPEHWRNHVRTRPP
jgi:hypothetical protein